MKTEKIYIELLVLKIQTGDSQAWDDLLTITQVKVRAFAIKLLGQPSAVDDCIQETLLAIFKKINQLKDVKSFHTWLYQITYSKCMDYCRKNPKTEDMALSESADMTAYEQIIDIKSAIAALPESHQVIIFLFYYEGFTVAEMAEVLQKPVGTIKYQLFSARDHLKNQLTITNESEKNHEY